MTAPADTLERDHELDRVAAALDEAAAGRGRMVVIVGPPGIGKTRLVGDVRALAKVRGFGRLEASCDELESAMSWSVIRQMVERSVSRASGRETRAQLLAGPSGAALAAIDEAPAEATGGDAAIGRTMHALWWIAADLAAQRPLLISVDDAQWADLPSLRFLAYLARRLADLPIVLLIATRPPSERSGPLADLCAARDGERIVPAPLSRDAVCELAALRCATPAAALVDAVHAASAGNPFLAGMLLDELEARGMALDEAATAGAVGGLGPATISRSVLARLSPDAIALASAAGVLGARGDRWLAAAIAELRDDRLAAAIDALVGAQVLAADRGQLVFVQPVVREAVLAQLGPGERAALHARAALALRDSGASVARIAAHVAYAPTGTLPGAAALLREAAAVLLADGDAATAATHLGRALEVTPGDHAVEADLGRALLRAGDPVRARGHLRAAGQAASDPHERAELLAGAASATALIEGPAVAIADLRAVLEDWPQAAGEPASLVLEARLAAICSMLPSESRTASARLSRFAGLPGERPEERMLLALLAQRQRYDVRPANEVAVTVARALGGGAYLADVADGPDGMVGWVVAVLTLVAAEGIEPATEELARARARVRDSGSPLEFGMVSNVAALLAWRTGDVAATEAECEAALAAVAAEEPGPQIVAVRATATHFAVVAALERGERAQAGALLERFDAACAHGPRVIPVIWLRDARATYLLACDQPQLARDEAIGLGEEVRAALLDTPVIPWRVPAALAQLRLGDEQRARTLADEHLALARQWGTATDTGIGVRLLARVDADRRLDLLAEAIGVLEGSPARLEHARALVDLGEALRVARRRSDAHEPLRRGAELATACGSRVLRQRALDGLAALGDRPRKLMFSGAESLTASERRVAQLATEGRSNRDIAQELFVSPKTIENHLGRVYMKLGISGRRQLAEHLLTSAR